MFNNPEHYRPVNDEFRYIYGGDLSQGVLIDAGWFRDRGIIHFSEYTPDNNQVIALPIDIEGYPYLYREYIIKPDDITQRAINKIGDGP
jgi:hypothetical protein